MSLSPSETALGGFISDFELIRTDIVTPARRGPNRLKFGPETTNRLLSWTRVASSPRERPNTAATRETVVSRRHARQRDDHLRPERERLELRDYFEFAASDEWWGWRLEGGGDGLSRKRHGRAVTCRVRP